MIFLKLTEAALSALCSPSMFPGKNTGENMQSEIEDLEKSVFSIGVIYSKVFLIKSAAVCIENMKTPNSITLTII